MVDNGFGIGVDQGRQIQVDMYMPNQSYPTNCWPCNSGCHWGWNPVQAGSCASGNVSGGWLLTQQPNLLVTRTQPLHWDNELRRSAILLDQRLEFVLWNALKITYTITNYELFPLTNASFDVPVAYLETTLNRAVAYKGSQPWTNGPLTTLQIPVQNNTSIDVQPAEHWMAWLETYPSNGADYGVALYVPPQGNGIFYGMGRLDGPNVPATNFMQVFQSFTLAQGQSKSVIAYLITGTVEEIRASIYTLAGH